MGLMESRFSSFPVLSLEAGGLIAWRSCAGGSEINRWLSADEVEKFIWLSQREDLDVFKLGWTGSSVFPLRSLHCCKKYASDICVPLHDNLILSFTSDNFLRKVSEKEETPRECALTLKYMLSSCVCALLFVVEVLQSDRNLSPPVMVLCSSLNTAADLVF